MTIPNKMLNMHEFLHPLFLLYFYSYAYFYLLICLGFCLSAVLLFLLSPVLVSQRQISTLVDNNDLFYAILF